MRALERFHFGSEGEVASRTAVVERLDAHAIAREQEMCAARPSQKAKANMPSSLASAASPHCTSARSRTSVSPEVENFAPSVFQLRAQLAEVVDLAVEDEPGSGVGVVHGLAGGVAKVEDGKASVSEDEAGGIERELDAAAGVGTAMLGGGNHVAHRCARLLRPAVAPQSDNSAHSCYAAPLPFEPLLGSKFHGALKLVRGARPIHFALHPMSSVLAEPVCESRFLEESDDRRRHFFG